MTPQFLRMGDNTAQQNTGLRQAKMVRSERQAAELFGRRLLDVVVYRKLCHIGGKLDLNELVETTEIGDWKMPDFKSACADGTAQGWLIIEGDTLTLTTAGFAAA